MTDESGDQLEVPHSAGSSRTVARKRRKRRRPKGAPTFVASIPLEVAPAQRAEITKRFDAAGKLYNACLGEVRVAWLREKVFAQEAKALGSRAYNAVNERVKGKRGKPRFKKVQSRGLHSLECNDLHGSMGSARPQMGVSGCAGAWA